MSGWWSNLIKIKKHPYKGECVCAARVYRVDKHGGRLGRLAQADHVASERRAVPLGLIVEVMMPRRRHIFRCLESDICMIDTLVVVAVEIMNHIGDQVPFFGIATDPPLLIMWLQDR